MPLPGNQRVARKMYIINVIISHLGLIWTIDKTLTLLLLGTYLRQSSGRPNRPANVCGQRKMLAVPWLRDRVKPIWSSGCHQRAALQLCAMKYLSDYHPNVTLEALPFPKISHTWPSMLSYWSRLTLCHT